MKHFLLLLLLPGGLLFSSCAPSTPQTRIQQHPELFAALSPKHQELVQQGTLAKGMPRDAVVLAWGPPAQRFEGSQAGQASERWDYSGAQPVFSQGFHGGVGFGCGYGRHGRFSSGHGFMPEVIYVPYRRASVWFLDRRVDSWERIQ